MTDTLEVLKALSDQIDQEVRSLSDQIQALTSKRDRRQQTLAAVSRVVVELRDLEADHGDQPPAPVEVSVFLQPVSEPVVPEPEQVAAKTGPWSDDFLAECYEEQLRGKTVKQIADERGVAYNQFSSALKKFRENLDAGEGDDAPGATADPEPVKVVCGRGGRASVTVDGRVVMDPDPERESSGWSFEDDIQLLEDLGAGMKAARAAELFTCDVETIKARYALLVPSRSFEDQGKTLKVLRALDEADTFHRACLVAQ